MSTFPTGLWSPRWKSCACSAHPPPQRPPCVDSLTLYITSPGIFFSIHSCLKLHAKSKKMHFEHCRVIHTWFVETRLDLRVCYDKEMISCDIILMTLHYFTSSAPSFITSPVLFTSFNVFKVGSGQILVAFYLNKWKYFLHILLYCWCVREIFLLWNYPAVHKHYNNNIVGKVRPECCRQEVLVHL